jgi:LPXTG-motif cell wall-anchored protein
LSNNSNIIYVIVWVLLLLIVWILVFKRKK